MFINTGKDKRSEIVKIKRRTVEFSSTSPSSFIYMRVHVCLSYEQMEINSGIYFIYSKNKHLSRNAFLEL